MRQFLAQAVIVLVAFLSGSVFSASFDIEPGCWKDNYLRGAGTPLNACPDGYELDAAWGICYPRCADGFYGVGPVCWEKCPPGTSDVGALCSVPLEVRGKGCCCTLFSLWCCGNCPNEFVDDGCTCRRPLNTRAKRTYGRGVGVAKICGPGLEQDGLLCYNKCPANFYPVGPICWGNCNWFFSEPCGAACARDRDACAKLSVEFSIAGISIFAQDRSIEDISHVTAYNLPYCKNTPPPWSSAPPAPSTTTTTKPTTATTTTTTTTKPTTTTVATTTKAASATGTCNKGDGYYPDLASNCKKYYRCVYSGTANQQVSTFSCPDGLLFDTRSSTCNWAGQVTTCA